MRIGLVIYGSLDTLSGGYLYDRKLVDYLRSRGDHVEIFSLPWRSYSAHLRDNFSVRWMNVIARARLDVLLQDELNHPSLFVLNRHLRRRASFPVISIVHHLRCAERRCRALNALYREVERAYIRSVDGFIYNSRTTRGTVEALLGRGRQGRHGLPPCVVAYPGGDRLDSALGENEISRRAFRDSTLRMLFVGNIIPRKGLNGFLTALAGLNTGNGTGIGCDWDWELTLAGSLDADPAYARTLTERVASSGMSGKVRFVGAVSDARLAELLAGSDLMALPCSYEGFGIACLEGMAFGLPALVCSSGGAREIVRHGESGYLIDQGDIEAIRTIITALAVDRERLLKLSLSARRRFNMFPTWEQTTAAIRKFISGSEMNPSRY